MSEPTIVDLTGDHEIEVIDLTGDDLILPYHGIQGQRPLPVFGAPTPIAAPSIAQYALPAAPALRRSHRLAEIQSTKRRNQAELSEAESRPLPAPRKRDAAPTSEPDLLSDLLTTLSAPTANTPPPQTPHAREEKQLDLFSDGSFLPSGRYGGCGVAYKDSSGNWCGRAVALGRIDGSGEAELHGVYEAFRVAEALIGTAKSLVIHSDVITMEKRLQDARITGGSLRWPILTRILKVEANLVALGVATHIRWVRGHSVSIGNNVADMLAGYGSQRSSTGMTGCFDNPDSAALQQAVQTAKQRQTNRDRKQRKATMRRAAK